MTEFENHIRQIRELKKKWPKALIYIPPCSDGLPAGSNYLGTLLEFIAMNLEGQKPETTKGVPRARS